MGGERSSTTEKRLSSLALTGAEDKCSIHSVQLATVNVNQYPWQVPAEKPVCQNHVNVKNQNTLWRLFHAAFKVPSSDFCVHVFSAQQAVNIWQVVCFTWWTSVQHCLSRRSVWSPPGGNLCWKLHFVHQLVSDWVSLLFAAQPLLKLLFWKQLRLN